MESAKPGNPEFGRYLALGSAAVSWNDVAALCPSRFAEGTMRNAQMQYRRSALARQLGLPVASADEQAHTQTLDSLQGLSTSGANTNADGAGEYQQTVSTMALAEDEAGFAIQVLAARNRPGATLELSDNHISIAARLVSLGHIQPDPRKKIYDVSSLIKVEDPKDKGNGLAAPSAAVTEMTCAKTSMNAFPKKMHSESSNGNDGGAQNASDATLRALSSIIASRAYLAFSLGYPTFDEAVFDS